MKRSIIVTAALLLLFSGTTFAFHPRPRHRGRIVSGPEIQRRGWGHYHGSVWVERQCCYEYRQPVVYVEYEWTWPGGCSGPGWRHDWEHGRRPDWDRYHRGGRHGPEWPLEREHEEDRGRGHGRR